MLLNVNEQNMIDHGYYDNVINSSNYMHDQAVVNS